MKQSLRVLWLFIRAYLFYPAMIGIFLWFYVKDAHWAFGLIVIIGILVLDPLWGRMTKNAIRLWKSRDRSD